MRIKKVLSFVLTMTFVFGLVGNSSAVFADPTQSDTVEGVSTKKIDISNQNIVKGDSSLENLYFNNISKKSASKNVKSKVYKDEVEDKNIYLSVPVQETIPNAPTLEETDSNPSVPALEEIKPNPSAPALEEIDSNPSAPTLEEINSDSVAKRTDFNKDDLPSYEELFPTGVTPCDGKLVINPNEQIVADSTTTNPANHSDAPCDQIDPNYMQPNGADSVIPCAGKSIINPNEQIAADSTTSNVANYSDTPFAQLYPNPSQPNAEICPVAPYDQTDPNYMQPNGAYYPVAPYGQVYPNNMPTYVYPTVATQMIQPNCFVGCEGNPEMQAEYQTAAEANSLESHDTDSEDLEVTEHSDEEEAKENTGFFKRMKTRVGKAVDYVEDKFNQVKEAVEPVVETVSDNKDLVLNTVAAGTAAVGLYGLHSLCSDDSNTVYQYAPEIIGATTIVLGLGMLTIKAVEYIKNEYTHYQTGVNLPGVLKNQRFARFEKNIINPASKVIVGASVAGGMYFSPATTLKFASPIISSSLVKNRMDRYFGPNFANSIVSESIGFGVGMIVSPISTLGLTSFRILNSLVRAYNRGF